MMRSLTMIGVSLFVYGAGIAAADARASIQEVVHDYWRMNEVCRGETVYSQKENDACAARTGYGVWLHQAGWCDPGEGANAKDWHKCRKGEHPQPD